MISDQPVITVSPTETTRYRLKVQTVKGLIDYTDIIVYVKDVLECEFDYSTGNVISQYGTVLTKNQALSRNWNSNGSSIVTLQDYTSVNPHLTCANKGGLIFRSKCFVPENSETLIAGLSLDDVISLNLFNNTLQINGIDYTFPNASGESGNFLTFEISVEYKTDTQQWEFSASVSDTLTSETLLQKSVLVSFGDFESEISLYFIGNTVAKSGFYYGHNGSPIPIIRRSALSVPLNGYVVLDGSDSYDPDNEAITYQWYYKAFNDSRFKKLYKTDPLITQQVSETTYYRLQVSDFENTVNKEVIVTNYTIQKLDDFSYELKAVSDDVKDLYSYQWTSSDSSISDTNYKVIVQPLGTVIYSCLITELSTGITDTIEIQLEGDLRIIHCKDIHTGEYQEIKVYPDTRFLDKFIECKVNGENGFLAVGDLNNPNKSLLKCKFPNDSNVYAILIHI